MIFVAIAFWLSSSLLSSLLSFKPSEYLVSLKVEGQMSEVKVRCSAYDFHVAGKILKVKVIVLS